MSILLEIFSTSSLLFLGILLVSISLLIMYFENKLREQNHKISAMLSLVTTLAEDITAINMEQNKQNKSGYNSNDYTATNSESCVNSNDISQLFKSILISSDVTEESSSDVTQNDISKFFKNVSNGSNISNVSNIFNDNKTLAAEDTIDLISVSDADDDEYDIEDVEDVEEIETDDETDDDESTNDDDEYDDTEPLLVTFEETKDCEVLEEVCDIDDSVTIVNNTPCDIKILKVNLNTETFGQETLPFIVQHQNDTAIDTTIDTAIDTTIDTAIDTPVDTTIDNLAETIPESLLESVITTDDIISATIEDDTDIIVTNPPNALEDTLDYKKMPLQKLRGVVVEKSLTTDASKLKKNDLLKLLGLE